LFSSLRLRSERLFFFFTPLAAVRNGCKSLFEMAPFFPLDLVTGEPFSSQFDDFEMPSLVSMPCTLFTPAGTFSFPLRGPPKRLVGRLGSLLRAALADPCFTRDVDFCLQTGLTARAVFSCYAGVNPSLPILRFEFGVLRVGKLGLSLDSPGTIPLPPGL